MKIPLPAIIIYSLLYASCGTKHGKEDGKVTESDTTKFFQVSEYLQGQIKEVNTTPFFIYKIDVINGVKDSVPINTSDFNTLSTPFLTPDINDKQLKHYYKESIFEDQTTKGFTINYSTSNKDLELQSVDILLGDDGKTVKRVFLRKFYNYTDSSAIEQLSWKPEENFQINKSIQKKGNQETIHQTTVVWNRKN